MLTITNVRGDETIYGNQILSYGSFEDISFSIYPNPVINNLTIHGLNRPLRNVNLFVFDVRGKLITSEIYDGVNSNISLNVANLKVGIYFLNISKDDSEQIVKFIKD